MSIDKSKKKDLLDKVAGDGTTDKAKEKLKEVIGTAKEVVGKATNNPKLKAEGEAEQAEGKVQQFAGGLKDAAEEAAEAFKHILKKD